MPFACSICEQESTGICAYCTKDACNNHICERCGCCSDCCQCEVPLTEPVHEPDAAPPQQEAAAPTSDAPPAGIDSQPLADLWPPADTQPAAPEESGAEALETPEA